MQRHRDGLRRPESPTVGQQFRLRDNFFGRPRLCGGYLCLANITLTMASMLARDDLRFCQLIVADLRSLSVSSCASVVKPMEELPAANFAVAARLAHAAILTAWPLNVGN